MIRVKALVLGGAAFLVSHAVERAAWRSMFAPASAVEPWFLNSGRAVAFTAACLFIAALVGSAADARSHPGRASAGASAANAAVGAWLAMAAVLAAIGPGTIFPIALAVGALVAVVACTAGAFAGRLL